MPNIRLSLIVVLAAMAVACTVGRDFIRPNDNELVVGSTTKRAALVVVGEPSGKGFLAANGETVEVLTFLHVGSGKGTLPGLSPIRVMKLWFHGDVLIGKRFYSTFKSDSVTLDYRPASAIRAGMSEQEVIALHGQPNGEYRYPLLADSGARALVYGYTERTGSANVLNFVAVEFDRGGKVRKTSLEDGRIPVHQYETAAQAQQAALDAKRANDRAVAERAKKVYEDASVSRAALKQYLEANPNGTYAEKAKADLEVSLGALTVRNFSVVSSRTVGGTGGQMGFSQESTTFTVGKSTRKVVESFLGRGAPRSAESSSGLTAYSWRVQYKRGSASFSLWDAISGGPPFGRIILFFDASDVLRKIAEVD
jgi:hypothetical protein